MLDIIVPHYKEAWEVGKTYFDMLGCQRGVDFSKIRVILVHDGVKAFPEKTFSGYPFKVEQHVIPHGGVSKARNYGLEQATSEWVTFCDFDDLYANCYSLKFVMDVLPTKDYDLLWGPFIAEGNHYESGDDNLVLNINDEFNMVWIHNKYYRRNLLMKHGIRFNEELWFSEDSGFNVILELYINRKRIGTIKSPYPLYVWCYRKNSLTTDPENVAWNILGHLRRNVYVTGEFYKHATKYAPVMAARTITDAYINLNRNDIPEKPKPGEEPDRQQKLMQQTEDEIRVFFKEHLKDLRTVSEEDWNKVMKASVKQGKMCGYIREDRMKFAEWLNILKT